MRQLNVYFEGGRAAVAQQLHAVSGHAPVFAAPAVGALLAGVDGWQEGAQVFAPSAVLVLLAGVSGGLGLDKTDGKHKPHFVNHCFGDGKHKKKQKTRSAVERGVPSWMIEGEGG